MDNKRLNPILYNFRLQSSVFQNRYNVRSHVKSWKYIYFGNLRIFEKVSLSMAVFECKTIQCPTFNNHPFS